MGIPFTNKPIPINRHMYFDGYDGNAVAVADGR